MIRVILADDHHLVRQGIRALIERADDIEVIGESEDGYQAVQLVERLVPDVLVTDIAMPRFSGIQAVEQICKLGLPTGVIILSIYSDQALVRQALRSGAKGYLLKSADVEELLVAIRAVSRGNAYLTPAISAGLITDFLTMEANTGENSSFEQLSPREREVLKLIAEGYKNIEIATLLTISVKTVEKHRAHLMTRLGVHDMAGLIRTALKFGLIFLDE